MFNLEVYSPGPMMVICLRAGWQQQKWEPERQVQDLVWGTHPFWKAPDRSIWWWYEGEGKGGSQREQFDGRGLRWEVGSCGCREGTVTVEVGIFHSPAATLFLLFLIAECWLCASSDICLSEPLIIQASYSLLVFRHRSRASWPPFTWTALFCFESEV